MVTSPHIPRGHRTDHLPVGVPRPVIGPMPFTTYQEVSEYSSFISYVTATKYMPPWTPDPDYSTLRGERFLTDDEIELLAEWHEAGAPEGDLEF